ncbi:putative nucleoside-diphosphate-sugar epimerase [Cryphonectria parasitica EP155]|uniref:Nucleoside-diphosphate-sugar epimerase n=1 Tax=Cryphonectria parasitica (strain ATCC 38755 / EP155) TaxID=660469 RepID=A0A9P4Y2N0_CRYP1|nr:putative nucleoside-diphosphate-sugar epimerase [Cryphonectria parasitica EP155]KAF3765045.1 putative nucleoside-diphosphate-sugar epimerase [Cryphonectria parasitica EP155]
MKLIIGGSTGFVGTELVRQALLHPHITSVVALGRRETPVPSGSEAGGAKLRSVVCDDFETYNTAVQKELEGADACIWTISITPSKLKDVPWEETCKISRDYAVAAIKHLAAGRAQSDTPTPFRFIYMSGIHAKRDRAEAEKVELLVKNPTMLEYTLIRGDAEVQILEVAKQSNGKVEACVTRPGLILGADSERRAIPGIPSIEVEEIAAAQLHQVINGFKAELVGHDDLVSLGQEVLSKR